MCAAGRGDSGLAWPAVERLPAAGLSQTDWSMIRRAAGGEAPESEDALERVARRYWPAIFAFLRSQGRDVHEAADLTQGFLCDVLLGRQLLAGADPQRGRFRALLLSALQNYVRDQHRRSRRLKRAVRGVASLNLDQSELAAAAVDPGATPERAFRSQWGATLMAHVLEQVRQECLRDGLEAHWRAFERRVVEPALFGHPAPEYGSIVEHLSLRSASQAANMVVTVKRRLVKALVAEVRHTVDGSVDVEAELRDLLRDLEEPR